MKLMMTIMRMKYTTMTFVMLMTIMAMKMLLLRKFLTGIIFFHQYISGMDAGFFWIGGVKTASLYCSSILSHPIPSSSLPLSFPFFPFPCLPIFSALSPTGTFSYPVPLLLSWGPSPNPARGFHGALWASLSDAGRAWPTNGFWCILSGKSLTHVKYLNRNYVCVVFKLCDVALLLFPECIIIMASKLVTVLKKKRSKLRHEFSNFRGVLQFSKSATVDHA